MRYATFLLACALTVAVAPPARAADEPLGPKTGFSLDEAGLRKLADAIREDSSVLKRLRPTYSDCRDIAPEERDAIRLVNGSHHEIETIIKRIQFPKTGTTDVYSWVVGTKADSTFEAMLPKAKRFQEGIRFWAMSLGAGPDGRNPEITAFIAHKGRWILVPLPHLTIDDKSYPDDAMTLFLGLAQTGDTDSAYDLLSTHLQDRIAREEFPAKLRALGLHDMRTMKTAGNSNRRVRDQPFVRRTWDIERNDGQQLEVSIYATHDGKQTRIVHIDTQSRFGLPWPAVFLPPAPECRDLARRTLVLLAEAFKSRKIEPVLAASMDNIREELTPERFQEVFAKHIKAVDEFDFVTEGNVLWARFPFFQGDETERVDREKFYRSNSDAPLVLTGVVVSKDKTKRLPFTLLFKHRTQWRIHGLNVSLPEPVPTKK